MIDNRYTFEEHLAYIIRKCVATTDALALKRPNLGSPMQEERQLLYMQPPYGPGYQCFSQPLAGI